MHSYCRISVKLARIEAKEKGISIPSFGGSCLVGTEQYAISLGAFYIEEDGCCAFEARSKALYQFIDQYEKGIINKKGKKIK